MGYYMPTEAGEYDPVQELLRNWCEVRYAPYSDTKKAQEIADARLQSYRVATGAALSYMLNERRLSFFEKLAKEQDILPALMASTCAAKLSGLQHAWRTSDRAVKWEDFWATDCQAFILDLLATDDIMELETARHRKAVIEGREDPRPSDTAWLAEESARQEKEAQALREAADAAEQARARLARLAGSQSQDKESSDG